MFGTRMQKPGQNNTQLGLTQSLRENSKNFDKKRPDLMSSIRSDLDLGKITESIAAGAKRKVRICV